MTVHHFTRDLKSISLTTAELEDLQFVVRQMVFQNMNSRDGGLWKTVRRLSKDLGCFDHLPSIQDEKIREARKKDSPEPLPTQPNTKEQQ